MPQLPGQEGPRRPLLRYVLWIVIALLVITAFGVVTPYIFLAVGHIRPQNWTQFSNEGQAYGGIAAVIGMLAIVGIIASLILQTRESTANRVQMERVFHAGLLQMSFEDPELLESWGLPYGDLTEIKQIGYVNLIFGYWFAMVEIGRKSEAEMRRSAAEIFAGAPARTYWRGARSSWIEATVGRTYQRCIAIVDQEYQRAAAGGPAISWPKRQALVPEAPSDQSTIKGLAVGTLSGAAIALAAVLIFRRKAVL